MIAVNPIHAAISAHRAAYDAFQVAPGGDESDESMDACCVMADALDALVLAACAFPILAQAPPEGADAFLVHLRWWLADEAVFAADYQPQYGILRARAADLAAVLEPPAGDQADPVVAAIVAADMATAAVSAALVHRNEDDDASETLIEAGYHVVDVTFSAVQQTMPGTLAGVLSLTRFYERDAKIFCRWDTGGDYLGHVAAALAVFVARERQASLSLTGSLFRETKSFPGQPEIACDSAGPFSGCQQKIAAPDQQVVRVNRNALSRGIPGQPEVEAAWHALPVEIRDRIGTMCIDMVLQSFVSGAAYSPKNRAIPGKGKVAHTIREAADNACNNRLTEMHRVVEDLLPDLFGPAGENPEWAVAMGALR